MGSLTAKSSNTNKVIVIGLDGATFNVLNPMMEKGIMPNLKKLIKKGIFGEIDTYVTGMGQGWVSFMTGKDPVKHGIFYWTLSKGVTSSFIKDKTLWDILSDYGKKVGLINVPYTYPPKQINGFLISGLGGGVLPSTKVVFTYPQELYSEILREVGKYERGWITLDYEDPFKFVNKIIQVTKLRIKTAKYLYKKYDCDFFMIVFRGMDAIQHRLWNYIDFKFTSEDDIKVVNLIQSYYNLVDSYIGMIIKQNPDKNIFIISDHGFVPSKAIVYLNEFLAQKGYLVKNEPKVNLKLKVLEIAKMLLGAYYKKFLMYRFINKFNKFRTKKLKLSRLESSTNWDQTLAFASSPFGISINLKEKYTNLREKYEKLRKAIITELSQLKYPDSGENVFEKVYKKEAINLQRNFEIAPDILFEYTEGFQGNVEINFKNKTIFMSLAKERFKFGTGIHARNGILIAWGKCIKNNLKIKNAKIIDVAPTILSIIGLPIPNDMDGRVLKEIIKTKGK